MGFNNDQPQQTNQIVTAINLPDIEEEPNLFQERLQSILQKIANTVNSKEGAFYSLEEKSSSGQYFAKSENKLRNVYRKVLDFVALNGTSIPAGETISFPHGMTNISASAMIYANCSSTDGLFFTVVFPDVYVTDIDAVFTNSYSQPLSQVDVIIQTLKE